MKPIDIIKKLTSIMIDSKYYHINGMYKIFIDSKIAYEKIIPAIPPKKEMTLLLRMINNLYQNIVVFNKNKERIDNNELRKLLLSRFEVIMQLVDETLHFICLGKIELIQQEYINLWIANNPHYKIKVWTDNNAYYARELFSRIRKKTSWDILNNIDTDHNDFYSLFNYSLFNTEIIKWQNKIYQHMLSNKKVTFDKAILDFLVKNSLGENKELSEYWNDCHNSFRQALAKLKKENPHTDISIEYMDTIFDPNEKSLLLIKELYIKELALRNNLTAASDIFRLLILKKQGGICIDNDLLPEINKKLFSKFIKKTSHDPDGMCSQAAILSLILNSLMKEGSMPGRAKLIDSYQLAAISPELKQEIEQLIKQTQKNGISLFMPLEEPKVDPYFQFSYIGSNNKITLAKKNSPFIDRLLLNLSHIHQIIDTPEHHINGLSDPLLLSESVSPTLQQILSGLSCKTNAQALISYRKAFASRDDHASAELYGMGGYQGVSIQLLDEIHALSVNNRDLLPTLMIPFTIKASFLTEEADQSRLLGAMRYRGNFIPSPQYYRQQIIQLGDDNSTSKAAAQFLYNKNRQLTTWYRYDGINHRLIKIAATLDNQHQYETHITLVGNGTRLTLNPNEIASLLAVDNGQVIREQLTFLGCRLSNNRTNDPDDSQVLLQNFINDLYPSLHENRIKINRIIVQEKLLTVDMMGHQWIGNFIPPSKNSALKIDWAPVTKEETKIEFSQTSRGINKQYQPIEHNIALALRTVTKFNREHFSVGDVMQTPQINPEKNIFLGSNKPEKFDEWIGNSSAHALQSAVAHAPVLVNADSMALLAAMGEGNHEIVIVDNRYFRMAALIKILQHSLEKQTYQAWYDDIDFIGGKFEFNLRIQPLLSNPQAAFQRLQRRVMRNQFTFYQFNLSKPNKVRRILETKHSKAPFNAIYLGNIHHFLLANVTDLDDNQSKLNKVKTAIDQLNTAMYSLHPQSAIPLYYYALHPLKDKSAASVERCDNKNTQLIERYSHINAIHRANSLTFTQLQIHLKFISEQQYNTSLPIVVTPERDDFLQANPAQPSTPLSRERFNILGIMLGIFSEPVASPFANGGRFTDGIALAVMRYFLPKMGGSTRDRTANAKIIDLYFNQMKKGWDQGGFLSVKNVLIPYQGVVIRQINLANKQWQVTFDNEGQQIGNRPDSGTDINLRELAKCPLRKNIAVQQKRPGVKTLILPGTPKANIEAVYDLSAFTQRREEVERDSLGSTVTDSGKGRKFADDTSWIWNNAYYHALIGLDIHYQYTEVKIFLGNDHYKLIAPGVAENQPVSHHIYQEQLYYVFYAPPTQAATVVLVLNNAQANMKIECENKDTQWIIDAYHLSGIQSRFEVKQEGEVKIYFERVVNIGNNQSQQQTISILTIAHRATTKLIVQLPEGGFTVDLQAFRLVPLVISITPIPGSDQQIHKIGALKRYIQNHTVNFKETVKYIRIVGFNPSDEQRDFSLYDLQRELFLYTASDPESVFSGTLRKNCQLLFINQEYAWYQGDWVIPMDGVSNRVHIYENIIWVSEIKSHRLLQIYLPLGHLPNIQEREQQVFTSPSTVTAPRVMSQAIIFTQQYTYDNQTIKLKYCIDLSNPEKGLALIELTDLPGGISDQLIQSGNLENLVLFMKNQVQNRLLFSQLNNIDPWKRSGNNIKPLRNGQTDTTLSIRNRLLWPLKNSMAVKGKIVANINNRHFFSRQLKPAGIVKARHPNKNHYFFWSLVTTHNNPFDTLYVQKGNNEAKVMDLTEFGLNQADIIHLKDAFITTKQGLIYRLSDDKTLTLAGIDEAFFSNYSDWSSALTIQIMQLQARLGDATLLPEGQKKAINIAPHLTILGLLQCDEQRLLPLHAWYDKDSQQFIFCKSDPDQNMIFQGLSEDRKGAWLLNDKGENNKEIGYLPVIDKAFISTLFIGSILQHEDQLPTISMLKLDAAFGAGFINAKVMKQRKKIQGNIQGLTARGMVITVGKTADNQFSVTLGKVTPLFTYQYGTDMPRLKIALKNLCDNLSQNYRYAEMIEVVLQNNQVGWYFPSKNILLTGLIQGDNCLGFNSDRRLAYFVNNQSGVFSVNQGGTRHYIDNSSYRYRRSNNILLLNSGSLVTLDVDAHINIDVPALAIMTSIDQSIIDTFRFDLTLFTYSIIYLFHLGKGLLYATLSPEIEPEDMTITRKSGFLVVFINNKLLVINDAFKPGKTTHPVYQHQTNHNKIKFVFSHRGTISVKQLVDHYIKTIGNEINDGSIVIPIPDIDLY